MQEDLNLVYDTLFRKTYAKLFFYVKGIVGEDDAQDIVEDVFVDVWRRRDSIEFGDKIQSFLYRSAYTHSINLLRRRKMSSGYINLMNEINTQRIEFVQSDTQNPEKDLENDDLRRILDAAISELPEKCREVFKLSYIQGMRNDEIAEITGTSVRTVEAHMYRALKYLRQRLGDISISLITFLFLFKYLL